MGFLYESTFHLETIADYRNFADKKSKKMRKKSEVNATPVCQARMQAISDAMSLLSGKWKFLILGTLIEGKALGFMDLLREVNGIGSKMLSKELQDLEMNNLISRTVMNTRPVTVSYTITDHGKTLSPLIDEMAKWGISYRLSIFHQNEIKHHVACDV